MIKTLYSGFFVFSLSSILILIAGTPTSVEAQSFAGAVKQVRSVEIDHVFREEFFGENSSDLLGADGVPFPPGAHTLLKLTDSEGASLVLVTPPASERGRITLTPLEIDDPINTTFDSLSPGAKGFGQSRLFLLDTQRGQLVAVKGGARDELLPEGIGRFNLRGLRIANPQGMTLQPSNGALYILDAEGPSVTRLTPRLGQDFAGASVSLIDLPRDLGTLRGLAFNPEDSHLYVINPERKMLYKVTLAGEVVAVFDLPVTGLPQGMIFAPSLDLTDHPGVFHLYLASTDGARSEVSELVLPGSLSPRANFPFEE